MAWARSDGKDASWGWRWQLGSSRKEISDDRPIKWRGPVAHGAVARESIKLISQFFSVPLLSGRG